MCGIIGVIGGQPVSRLIYHSLFSIQHRGQSSAGMLTYDGNIHVTKEAGLVRDVFNEEKKIRSGKKVINVIPAWKWSLGYAD
jgi:glutamine phosphoribosylpyrophosphate amidotransferase